VTEAREQLMQEKGAQVREHSIFCSYVLCYVSCFVKFLQGQSHYDPEQRAVPLCQEYVLSPQDMARRMANESDNQEIPTEAETEIASQNNGFYQKPNGQWAQVLKAKLCGNNMISSTQAGFSITCLNIEIR